MSAGSIVVRSNSGPCSSGIVFIPAVFRDLCFSRRVWRYVRKSSGKAGLPLSVSRLMRLPPVSSGTSRVAACGLRTSRSTPLKDPWGLRKICRSCRLSGMWSILLDCRCPLIQPYLFHSRESNYTCGTLPSISCVPGGGFDSLLRHLERLLRENAVSFL